jgi:uncharacterized protein involved in exopolysaccharide biosynthesis
MSHIEENKSKNDTSDELNLIDYLKVIKKYRKSIIAIVVAASLVSVVVSLLLPKTYMAEAVIIPVSARGGSSLSGLASQFGGLASLAGVSLSGGAADDASKIIAILKSRTLTENVINRENLMPILFGKKMSPGKQPSMEEAVQKMRIKIEIAEDKRNKKIKIKGEFRDPKVAARVVNAYIVELQKFISVKALTVAKRNRIFIEGQLEQNKRDLLEAGKEINAFYMKNKISNVDADVDVSIDMPNAEESNEISRLAYDGMSENRGVKSDVGTLMLKKNALDEKISKAKVVKDIPQQVYLTYLMMRRELLAQVNSLLTTQYEMAKIEEAKEELTFEVIDKAIAPEQRYKPKRSVICITTFFAAFIAAVFLAFVSDYFNRLKVISSGA